MVTTRALRWALTLGLAGVSGANACYSPPEPDCGFVCGPRGECPSGYACGADRRCKRDGAPPGVTCTNDAGGDAPSDLGDLGDAGDDATDAALDAPPDAALDAPLDAALDAPLDAALDAPLDAAVDAALDAAVDAPLDAAVDAALDAAVDAPLDAAVDASLDAAVDAPSATGQGPAAVMTAPSSRWWRCAALRSPAAWAWAVGAATCRTRSAAPTRPGRPGP